MSELKLSTLQDGQGAIIFEGSMAVVRCGETIILGGPKGVGSVSLKKLAESPEADFVTRICPYDEALNVINKYYPHLDTSIWEALMYRQIAQTHTNRQNG